MPAGQGPDGRTSRPTAEQVAALREFDTCTLANAIEEFQIRLRNEGYTLPGLRCFTGAFPPVAGFAATWRVRAAEPPLTGHAYLDRTDWWTAIESLPSPRIAVIEDVDPSPSAGACVGEVHAAILKALGCQAVVTNGAVRDLPEVERMEFPMFARDVAVSHAYRHLVDFGGQVNILGLEIRAGDLLIADCHGVLSVPIEIAAELPAVASRLRARESRIVEVCLSPGFSIERLHQVIEDDRQ
jgi:4-hydroxy-4-methyl-2-oxoglutarate aldolase